MTAQHVLDHIFLDPETIWFFSVFTLSKGQISTQMLSDSPSQQEGKTHQD